MITDQQVKMLRNELGTGMALATAAVRSGMSEKTARKYRNMTKLPSQSKTEHLWRTRVDPFEDVWQEVQRKLEQAPELQAKTIFQWLKREHPGAFQQGQLRTLQRRIKRWRATDGPPKEVYFDQVHHPGDLCASDFTHMNELGITIAKQSFDHMLYHFVLTYSNWESVSLCYSESFESLSQGFQDAIGRLSFVPKRHRTDRLSAAVNNLTESRDFTTRYQGLMNHYSIAPEKIQPRRANENGDVESSHRHIKSAIAQALLLRGSSDFATVDEYMTFVQQQVDFRNASRSQRLEEEKNAMAELKVNRLDTFTQIDVRVNRSSLIRVQGNVYSVHSRLIGEQVRVRILAESIEVWYAQAKIETLSRLRGRGKHHVSYRHVIDWLIRKPGALENYRYRDDLFPTSRFRMAFDGLNAAHTPRIATAKYLEILELAAKENETAVDEALQKWLDDNGPLTVESIRQSVLNSTTSEPLRDVEIDVVNLSSFDELLSADFFTSNPGDHDDKEVIEVNVTNQHVQNEREECIADKCTEETCQQNTEYSVARQFGANAIECQRNSVHERGAGVGDAIERTSPANVSRTLPRDGAAGVSRIAELRTVPLGVGQSGMPDSSAESHCNIATPVASSERKSSVEF